MQMVEHDLQQCFSGYFPIKTGVRLPGIWNMFEAGIRAVLGQQISIVAARNLVSLLVVNLGKSIGEKKLFPSPESVANSELNFLKIPNSRKQTLRNLAQHYLDHETPDEPEPWLKLKGIGPWTVDYAQLRGLSDPDIFLGTDLGVKKAIGKAIGKAMEKSLENAMEKITTQSTPDFNSEQASPWRSYLTFQLWSQL